MKLLRNKKKDVARKEAAKRIVKFLKEKDPRGVYSEETLRRIREATTIRTENVHKMTV